MSADIRFKGIISTSQQTLTPKGSSPYFSRHSLQRDHLYISADTHSKGIIFTCQQTLTPKGSYSHVSRHSLQRGHLHISATTHTQGIVSTYQQILTPRRTSPHVSQFSLQLKGPAQYISQYLLLRDLLHIPTVIHSGVLREENRNSKILCDVYLQQNIISGESQLKVLLFYSLCYKV